MYGVSTYFRLKLIEPSAREGQLPDAVPSFARFEPGSLFLSSLAPCSSHSTRVKKTNFSLADGSISSRRKLVDTLYMTKTLLTTFSRMGYFGVGGLGFWALLCNYRVPYSIFERNLLQEVKKDEKKKVLIYVKPYLEKSGILISGKKRIIYWCVEFILKSL